MFARFCSGVLLALSVLAPPIVAHAADAPEVVASLRQRAEAGDAVAQAELGVAYAKGAGVKQDYAAAAGWFYKAAAQGNAQAEDGLGVLNQIGGGMPRNDARAAAWYDKAATQGWPEAESNLGILYDDGTGVAQDRAKAVELYRRAAEHGSAQGAFNLGRAYLTGKYLPIDGAQAATWLRKSAGEGLPQAQFLMGKLYDAGLGVPKDAVTAYAYYRIAAVHGFALATQAAAGARNRLSPQQIGDADRIAAAWHSGMKLPDETTNDAGPAAATPAAATPVSKGWCGYYWRMPGAGRLEKWNFNRDGTFTHEGVLAGGAATTGSSQRGTYRIGDGSIALHIVRSAAMFSAGGAGEHQAYGGGSDAAAQTLNLPFRLVGNGSEGMVLNNAAYKYQHMWECPADKPPTWGCVPKCY